jgi:chromosome segregation ATPase
MSDDRFIRQGMVDEIDRLRAALAAAKRENDILRSEHNSVNRELTEAQGKCETLRAELAAEREQSTKFMNATYDAMQRNTKLREALEYVGERVHRINWLAGLDAPIREQAAMAKDAIITALTETGGGDE